MDADMLRIVRFLVAGEATCKPAAKAGKLTFEGRRGTIAVEKPVLSAMARRGLIARSGAGVALTETGLAYWRRHRDGTSDFQSQHRDLEQGLVELGGAMMPASINRAESPLSVMAHRKDRDGRRFLSEEEFKAGERLRCDYTRGQMMPRLGANWQAAVASGHGRGERGGAAELTDAALASRQRVENAIRAVGPELAGVLIDVCCYLKGLETVERERGWPVRSAKIVLKSALSALARHYEPADARNSPRHVMLHWGTADYRPSIS